MTAEVRGSWRPAWLALGRVLRAQVCARGSDPVFSDGQGTLTRCQLVGAVLRRRRELRDEGGHGSHLVLHTDHPRTVLVDALAGMLAGRAVVVVPPRAGERALRAARASRSTARGVFFTTSGTTGTARVVRSGRGPRAMGQLVGLLGMLPRFHRPVVASLAPVSHGHGFSAFAVTMALGGHFVALGRDAVEGLAGLGPVDVLTGVPSQLQELAARLGAPRQPQGSATRIGLVLSGSDRLLDREHLEAVFGARVLDSYGTTETGTLTLEGRPLPGVRIQALDGRLRVRSPMLGAGVFASDLGFIRDGRVHVTGRADGVHVSGGENTAPAAVREWLLSLPGTHAVELTQRPDERFGSRTAVVVTTSRPVDGKVLRRAIRREFGRAATPAVVEVVLGPARDGGTA